MPRPKTRRVVLAFLKNLLLVAGFFVALLAVPTLAILFFGAIIQAFGFLVALGVAVVCFFVVFAIYATIDDIKRGDI